MQGVTNQANSSLKSDPGAARHQRHAHPAAAAGGEYFSLSPQLQCRSVNSASQVHS